MSCPIKRQTIRRLRAVAVIVNDASGPTRFDGEPGAIEEAAQAYGVKGEAQWSYETRGGNQVPWPRIGGEIVRDPQDAMADRALYLAERIGDMQARAWRDAYATVGKLMQDVLTAQAATMNALANRTSMQEDIIAEQNEEIRAAARQQQHSELDGMVGKVLDLAQANHAQTEANKTKPNGKAS